MKMKHTLLAAAALSLLSTTASAVDWGGYTRIGPGQKQASGDGQRCFNGGGSSAWGSAAPGHGGIGRLGNECETYAEFALSQGGEAGGVNYKTLLMTAVGSPGSVSPNADGNTMKIAQLYVEGKGFDVAPNVSFWVGRRFYHRADVHFDDSFYVMGGMQDNAGAGADGIDLGVGSLGVAVFRRGDSASTGNAGTLLNFDLQAARNRVVRPAQGHERRERLRPEFPAQPGQRVRCGQHAVRAVVQGHGLARYGLYRQPDSEPRLQALAHRRQPRLDERPADGADAGALRQRQGAERAR
jgi:maltoporin